MRFGMQRYAFIEGFPLRSGDNFQADDRGDQRRDEEQPPEAGGFLEDQDADEDGPHGADARPHGIGGPDRNRFARLGEKKHTEGCSNIRRLLLWTCKDSQKYHFSALAYVNRRYIARW